MIKNITILTTIIVASSFGLATSTFAACAPAARVVPLSLVDDNTYAPEKGLSGQNCDVKAKLDVTAPTQSLNKVSHTPVRHDNSTPTSLSS
jgi:hypothetical protein